MNDDENENASDFKRSNDAHDQLRNLGFYAPRENDEPWIDQLFRREPAIFPEHLDAMVSLPKDEHTILMRDVQNTVNHLTARQAMIYKWFFHEGLTSEDAAEKVGLSHVAVRREIHAIRQIIRACSATKSDTP